VLVVDVLAVSPIFMLYLFHFEFQVVGDASSSEHWRASRKLDFATWVLLGCIHNQYVH